MTEPLTFSRIVKAAKAATPGGRLNKQDRQGLMRRAAAMDLSVIDANVILDEVPPRHPVTRGIE